MPIKDLERVIYFDSYMVVRQGKSPYARKTLLGAAEYYDYIDEHPEDDEFLAEIGAQAIRSALKDMDASLELEVLKKEYKEKESTTVRHKLIRRMRVLTGIIQGKLDPSWIVLAVLPVLPPDLRPLVPLEGGRFASSDLNELYRRVLNRNIRLKRLMEIQAPDIIVKNEKRMLQESVDALIDNGRRGQPVRGSNKRPLKSLSEMLRGKQGRFRQNLLGRRVDYSGRSVIVVDPELKLDQCGIPKLMALELFKPYVFAGLIDRELAPNMRIARTMVEDKLPEVWDVLEDVVRDRPVLLNRAPTLHRLGIQAFYPILVDGKAIKIHPMVCNAFNADFDGDQMAVHVPLSKNAQLESKRLILSTKNILSPAHGRPLTVPSQDMILGLYYITKVRCNLTGEGTIFASVSEAINAYQCGQIALHARVKLRIISGEIVDTTMGRILLYNTLPKGADFDWINKIMTKKDLAGLVEDVYFSFDHNQTVIFLDKLKKLGYYHATQGGISLSLSDLTIPESKAKMLAKAEKEVEKTETLYMDGVITNGERYNKVISTWGHVTYKMSDVMLSEMEKEDKTAFENKDGKEKSFNPVYMFMNSGARGSTEQIRQLVGMRGPMARPNGDIMETPVRSNFKEGLRVFEYFISTHGARKGQADTALKTANSGYLTRRLVDVAQDVVVSIHDCKTLGYVELEDLRESGEIICPLSKRVFGRMLAADVIDTVTGEVILKQNQAITRDDIDTIAGAAVTKILVRSVLTCQAKHGVCAMCYGYDLSKGALVDLGSIVGIIAAQSIGEPGTQLTMKTFHVGGTATGFAQEDTYHARQDAIIRLKNIRTVINQDGNHVVLSRQGRLIVLSEDGRELQNYEIGYGSMIFVQDKQTVKKGIKLAQWDPNNKLLISEKAGKVIFVDLQENVTIQERFDEATGKSTHVVLEARSEKYQPGLSIVDKKGDEVAHYFLPAGAHLNVTQGQEIAIGDALVKIPKEASKTKDITGGLPRIAELFEARSSKDPSIISDINGEVVIGGLHRGLRKVSVISGEISFDYFVPRGKQLLVVNGEMVNAGDSLTTGTPVLHDILRILGPDVLVKYLVGQIQKIYRLQGVDINDKHVELIVRQMMRKVRIVDPGESDFLVGDRVDRVHLQIVNETLRKQGKRVANYKPLLMGLTQASLGTESFISAASFQETTRILAEAAMSGQVDKLYGLKENVIVGKLIPAGTGVASFKKKYLSDNDDTSMPSVDSVQKNVQIQQVMEY
jgi:DNA-directed RNA polymerase subunit beta'